jgi:hypothetical protein
VPFFLLSEALLDLVRTKQSRYADDITSPPCGDEPPKPIRKNSTIDLTLSAVRWVNICQYVDPE